MKGIDFYSVFRRREFKNFSFLSIAQFSNYLLPLIIFPYLIRVVGIDKFGAYILITAIIQYIKVFSDYGLNLIATKEITFLLSNDKQLNQYVSNVFYCKLALLALVIIVFYFYQFIVDIGIEYQLMMAYAFLFVLGDILLPTWFFQGVEKMKYIALFQFLSKLLFFIFILLFIKEPNDFLLIIKCQAAAQIIIVAISMFVMFKMFGFSFTLPNVLVIKSLIIKGWDIFISSFFVKMYNSTNVILLGFFASEVIVGYYAVAEKVVLSISNFLNGPFNQAIFPLLTRTYARELESFREHVRVLIVALLSISFVTSVLVFLNSDLIIELMVGSKNDLGSLLLQIMSLSIVFSPFGAFFTQILILQGTPKIITKIAMKTAVFNYLLLAPLYLILGVYGVAINVLLVRVFHVMLHLVPQKRMLFNKVS